MNDGSSTTFAELPDLLEQRPLYSRTSSGCFPRMTGTLWPESVRRWPRTVSTDGDGRLFEHPMLEPATDGTDGSALLATPQAGDGFAHNDRMDQAQKQIARGNPYTSTARSLASLLPTPTANDWKNAGYQKQANGRTAPTLPGAVGSAPTSPRSTGGQP